MEFQISDDRRKRLFSNGIFLITKVSYNAITELTSWMVQNRPEKSEFTILINSEGGVPQAVAYFASFLATLPAGVKLTGVAFGQCGSSAMALLQCCDTRIAVKHCGFFIHNVQTTLEINCQTFNRKTAQEQVKQARQIEEELVALQCKRTGMSRRQWMRLATLGEQIPGRAIFPKEALKLGLIDKIVARRPIF